MTKAGGLARSETRQYEKTDMASDKMNKGLPMTDGLSTGSETANPKFEGNMPTIQQKESTLMPEVQTPQTQQKESTMQNQSHQNGSTPDPPSHQGNQHRHISLLKI
ncbi:squamosa promoter binding protein-like 8 [Striga asiatica]|uniref:Squamosa promoter binding protein-like 8 n=1 Tax=Striga asiatica TaxID=4170 RepID=A0A5A7QYF7_STRAF|nr:squamosa promoter binding protein-like 8 [Striga asiatica]